MRMDNIRQDASWHNYRRALGKEDRELLDEMISAALAHAPALESSSLPRMEGLMLAILLEQAKETFQLEATKI